MLGQTTTKLVQGLRLPPAAQALWVGLDVSLAGGGDGVAAVGICVCAYQHGRPLEIVSTIYVHTETAAPVQEGTEPLPLSPDARQNAIGGHLVGFLAVVEQTAAARGIHVTYLAQDQSHGLAALNRLLKSVQLPPIPGPYIYPPPETTLADPQSMLHGALLLADPLFDRAYDRMDALLRLASQASRPELEPGSSPIYGAYLLAWVLYALVELRHTGPLAD